MWYEEQLQGWDWPGEISGRTVGTRPISFQRPSPPLASRGYGCSSAVEVFKNINCRVEHAFKMFQMSTSQKNEQSIVFTQEVPYFPRFCKRFWKNCSCFWVLQVPATCFFRATRKPEKVELVGWREQLQGPEQFFSIPSEVRTDLISIYMPAPALF